MQFFVDLIKIEIWQDISILDFEYYHPQMILTIKINENNSSIMNKIDT